MKFFNHPAKSFLVVLGVTVASSFFASYAFHKSVELDPELEAKISQKLGIKVQVSKFGLYVEDSEEGEKRVVQSWKLTNHNKKIVINLKRGDIFVTPTDGDTIIFEARSNHKTSSDLVHYTEDQEKLTLTDGERAQNVDLHLTIPHDFAGKLDLSSIKGEVSLENVAAEELHFSVAKGDLLAKDVSIPKITGANINGDVRVISQIGLSTEISVVHGDISIASADRIHTEYNLKSTQGEIVNPLSSAQNSKFRINASTVKGDIKIE